MFIFIRTRVSKLKALIEKTVSIVDCQISTYVFNRVTPAAGQS